MSESISEVRAASELGECKKNEHNKNLEVIYIFICYSTSHHRRLTDCSCGRVLYLVAVVGLSLSLSFLEFGAAGTSVAADVFFGLLTQVFISSTQIPSFIISRNPRPVYCRHAVAVYP